MRCPDCQKFVSYEEPQIEVNSVELSGQAVDVSVRVSLNCQDCGTELKDMEFCESVDFDHECKNQEKFDNKNENEGEDQFELENDSPDFEPINRQQTIDRRGKQIRNPRYQKTYYGFEGEVEIKCQACDEIIIIEVFAEEQASCFNEC